MKSEGEKGGAAEENLREKLRRKGVNLARKRVKAGPSTPVPSWKFFQEEKDSKNVTIKQHSPTKLNSLNNLCSVSARQLAAALWELQDCLSIDKMQRGGSGRQSKDKGVVGTSYLADPSHDQPEIANDLKRHNNKSSMQHYRATNLNRALQPASPPSYCSSMEMAPYNRAVSPTSSIGFKGKICDSNYGLKTSTELLKVLNRIWSLEEQHASNKSLIKALKMELSNAHMKINDLIQNQQTDHHDVEHLMKQITENELVRKNKERNRINTAVQSVKDELENERQLRKRSDSFHRKLSRELLEVKSSLSSVMKELEIERKSRLLLEDLCDEFAKGIKEYEQEVHALRQKHDEDWANRADRDHSILYISESWLDERMQMKLRVSQFGSTENNSIVEKLHAEVETSLQPKRMISNSTNSFLARDSKEGRLRRNSLESIPLKDVNSAPQDAGDEDSVDSDSRCFELNKPGNGDLVSDQDEGKDIHTDEKLKSDKTKKKLASRQREKGRNQSSFQVKFEEHIARVMSGSGIETQSADAENAETKDGNHAEMSQKSEICEVPEDGSYERVTGNDEGHGSSSNYVIDNLIGGHYLSSEGGNNMHTRRDFGETSHGKSAWRSCASPVREWMSKPMSTDLDRSKSSTKLPPGIKENTLEAKLLEARTMGHRSRLNSSKGFS